MDIKERFFHYITTYTTSDESSGLHPSAKREFDLAKILVEDLKTAGVDSVSLDDNCYIYAKLNATKGYEGKPSVGFISHMDTAPDYNGNNVKPIIHENYDGNDVFLPALNDYTKISDFPVLKSLKGKTLITTDGSSLLGADDKAGVSEIITMVDEIVSKQIPHPDIWVCFTPDEEIGEGAMFFSTDNFKPDFAYTVDGDYEGEISYENFNAASASFTIHGKNVHPGSAKNIMINAASIACEIQNMLPQFDVPEHTEGREGFFHLTDIEGSVALAKLSYIIRDHDIDLFNKKKAFLNDIAAFLNAKYGESTVELEINDSYFNMYEIIKKDMFPVDLAREAMKKCGVEPVSYPIRGGTDGAHISEMGLPCPNLGTGGYAFHGPYEFITLEAMNNVVSILIMIVKLLSEK